MTANRYYGVNNKGLASSLEKLASGYAINKAGDNAAGLAVSEKMRAQIGGLTQASKNAEDGISMVQTFEGALQETDSILQRMRTLAVQSANGSYQDDVDREAIQLEYDQLNDELNQIADTDYNGIIALNGGEMSDGLKVTVDDKGRQIFDYKGAKDAAAQAAKEAAQSKVEAEAAKAIKAAEEQELFTNRQDFCGETDANKYVDDTGYKKEGADAVWNTLKQTATSTDKTAPDELNVTFTYAGEDEGWKATAVTDKNGNLLEVSDEDLAKITADTTGVDNGGFQVKADGTDTGVNVIFDTHKPGKYDTATVKFTNMAVEKRAPDNQGIAEAGYVEGSAITAAGYEGKGAHFTLKDGVFTDENMDAERTAILDALKNVEFEATYNQNGKIATGMTENGATSDVDVFAADGTTKIGSLNFAFASGTLTIKFKADNTNNPNSAFSTSGDEIATITMDQTENNVTSGSNNTVKFKVNMDSYTGGDDKGAYKASSVAISSLSEDAQATQKAGMFDAAEEEAAPEEAGKTGVSVSNNFKTAERNLTYTDNMTLQVGARTKDSVKFTFEYATDGIGDLEANMNCSARKGGLETDQLSLLTQESANEAIDKIDNAINKISMVRGTFGAIQNRLEHKINNIDTNTENMTAAESRIRDTQMDKEMMKFTSSQILSQASQSMLAQANQLPQGVLQLLG